jgi:hypothetical protein
MRQRVRKVRGIKSVDLVTSGHRAETPFKLRLRRVNMLELAAVKLPARHVLCLLEEPGEFRSLVPKAYAQNARVRIC